MGNEDSLDALLRETRHFPPPAKVTAGAVASDPSIYARASADPEAFWSEMASHLRWMQPWREVLRWDPPHAEWFVGGKLNLADNCLDRHCEGPRRNKAAIIWVGEHG